MSRLRSWPAIWAVVGAWVLLSFLFAYVFPYLSYRTGAATIGDDDVSRFVIGLALSPARAPDVAIQAMPLFGGAMMTVLGVLVTGSGYSWDTWKTVATQDVTRRALITGSIAAASLVTVGLVTFVMALSVGTSSVIARAEGLQTDLPDPWTTLQALGAGLLVLETWLLIGCALGVVFRSTGLPLGLALIWTLVVENLLRGVGLLLPIMGYATDVLPGTATGSLVGALSRAHLGEATPGVLTDISEGRALVTVVLYAAAAASLAATFFVRRDLD